MKIIANLILYWIIFGFVLGFLAAKLIRWAKGKDRLEESFEQAKLKDIH